RRWLLENLEERVPRLAREHVRLVDDIDLGDRFGAGSVHRPLAEIARIVHAAIGRGVGLDDIEIGGAGPDAAAGIALPAWFAGIARLAPLAVQRDRENPRRRRLPDAARAGEQIAVRYASLRDRAPQSSRHVVLGDELAELLGAVLASQCNHGWESNDVRRGACSVSKRASKRPTHHINAAR